MLLLGVDVETTGLDDGSDAIIELGMVLWDYQGSRPVRVYNELVSPIGQKKVSEEITQITGIKQEDVDKYGIPPHHAASWFGEFESEADFIVAHNAPFDRGFIDRHMKLCTRPESEKPWIDTRQDVPWRTTGSRKLGYLAADHGFLNPFAHRALFDVLTMMRLMSQYDLDVIIERSKSPTVTLQAMVSFQEKDLAKQKGFYWKAETKQWCLDIKACDVPDFVKTCDFNVRTL